MLTWRQAMTDAVAFLEEQGIYGEQAEYIAKELIRIGERITIGLQSRSKGAPRFGANNWRDR